MHSYHLDFPRRNEFRLARATLLEARGGLTWAAEQMCALAEVHDWHSLVPADWERLMPGTRYLLADPEFSQAIPLKTGMNTIGRFADNDIVLEDRPVSRRHCTILVHVSGGCEVHDTASRNGTFVNYLRVSQRQLASGDLLRLACRKLVFLSMEDLATAQELHQDDAGEATPSL